MRCRSLVLLSALLILLTGCAQEALAEPIFAIVEGVEIPVSRVDHTLALDEAAYEFSLRWIEDADFLTEEEKQEQIALMEPPTREAAEQELIRMEVLNARAREAGITVTREEARARLDETNAIAEELAAQGEKSAVWMGTSSQSMPRNRASPTRNTRSSRPCPPCRSKWPAGFCRSRSARSTGKPTSRRRSPRQTSSTRNAAGCARREGS